MRAGPGRGELWFRLAVSLAGLAFLGYALSRHGVRGMASTEIALIGGAFFGGTALWSGWRLWRGGGGG